MCGRFTLSTADERAIEEELGVLRGSLPSTYRPRFNIAPTDEHFIVRQKYEDREIVPAKFGLINHWTEPGKKAAGQINARAEGIDKRPAFRGAFERGRCVVPADGFFEWTGPKDERRPLWFHRPNGKLVLMAGLYESWSPQVDTKQRTFAIVTTRSNKQMEQFHDRMPVILTDEEADAWLNPKEEDFAKLKALLDPAPEDALEFRYVSPLLNSPKNDERHLLEPAGEQLTLPTG